MGRIPKIACMVVALLNCAPVKADNTEHSVPPAVILGEQLTLKVDGITPYTDFEIVPAENGTLWAFAVRRDDRYTIVGASFNGSTWTPVHKITPSYKRLHTWAATTTRSGNPMIVWQSKLDENGQDCSDDDLASPCILFTCYSGTEWSKPEILARNDGHSSIFSMSVIRDQDAKVHLIYDGVLSPPEEYKLGILVVDGEFPNKLFHTIYNGKKWSAPRATTPRGKFSVSCPKLSLSNDGNPCLCVTVGPFSRAMGYKNSYLAWQKWDGKKWTNLERLTPIYKNIDCGQMVIDSKGIKHLWWSEDVVKKKFGRMKKNKVIAIQTLEEEGTAPSIGTDSKGRVYLCWSYGKTQLIVWNGKDWSSSITLPVSNRSENPPKFTHTSDGRVFLAYTENDAMIIQRIVIEGPS